MNPRLGMQPESRHSTCCRPYLGDQARRLEMIEIPLTRGQVALIDDEDYELVSKYSWWAWWNKNTKSFYACSTIWLGEKKKQNIYMHRLIMRADKFTHVDHIDHATLDNRKRQLRLATPSQNQWNRGPTSKNTSGYKGVSWDKANKKWIAFISCGGKRKNLGRRSDIHDAYHLYCEAALQLHGEFARVE